jgi:hypothetical protein
LCFLVVKGKEESVAAKMNDCIVTLIASISSGVAKDYLTRHFNMDGTIATDDQHPKMLSSKLDQ